MHFVKQKYCHIGFVSVSDMKRTDEKHAEKENAAFSRRALCYFVSPAFIKLCFIWP